MVGAVPERLGVPVHADQMLGRQLGRADRSEPKGARGLPREQQNYVSISEACQAHPAAGALHSLSSLQRLPPPRLCTSTSGQSSVLSGGLEPSQSLPGCSNLTGMGRSRTHLSEFFLTEVCRHLGTP